MTPEMSIRSHQCTELLPQERVAGSQSNVWPVPNISSRDFSAVVCKKQCYYLILAQPTHRLTLSAFFSTRHHLPWLGGISDMFSGSLETLLWRRISAPKVAYCAWRENTLDLCSTVGKPEELLGTLVLTLQPRHTGHSPDPKLKTEIQNPLPQEDTGVSKYKETWDLHGMMNGHSGAEKLAAVHVKAQWGTRALQLPGWGTAMLELSVLPSVHCGCC